MPNMRVLSLGAGVQSTTLLLMAERGEFDAKPDYAIFADTGWEPKRVYEHLAWLERTVTTIPIIRVSAGDLRDDALGGKQFATMPLYIRNKRGEGAMLPRQCTNQYKLVPIKHKIRELMGGPNRGKHVEMWVGISLDEVWRMKPAREKWLTNRWPLIEKRMDRNSCLLWLERHGYPHPPKSSCIGCPFHDDAWWRDLKNNSAEEWADAIAFDREIRRGHTRMDAEAFIHKSMQPLEDVDLSTPRDHGQTDIDDFLNECTGTCGVWL